LSTFTHLRSILGRVFAICLSLVFFTLIATAFARSQADSPPAPTPAKTPDAKTPADPSATAAVPKITSVVVFPQAASTTSNQDFVLEIKGTGFGTFDMSNVHVAVLPAAGVTAVQVLSRSQDNSTILAQFTAPTNYATEEVALSTGANFLTYDTGASSCDFDSKVKLRPQIVPKKQAGDKYGNGVAKNFHAIQLSIVNECPMAIVVPLGGINVVTEHQAQQPAGGACTEKGALVAFSLDHVTSIFSTDRKLTGRRAIYFNTVQALATLGSAVEPFFAKGFTQGVAILGGGFTTASKELLVDMSAEQLQNLTSQSFGSTEQIASHGSLQKFVFVRRSEKCKEEPIETDLRTGQFTVNWELSPASSQAPATQNAKAVAPAPQTK
jgi:hypothetical protein